MLQGVLRVLLLEERYRDGGIFGSVIIRARCVGMMDTFLLAMALIPYRI